MSKKIAEGIQGLVLDIKTGNGAFMNTLERAVSLGEMLQKVGEGFGLKTDVIYTSMNQPLGRTAGMGCEIRESIDALQGDGNKDLMDVVFELGGKLLVQAGVTRWESDTVPIMENLIESGKAYQKFEEMVTAQGGDLSNLVKQNQPLYEVTVPVGMSGYIESMNTLNIGWACVELGCGRRNKDDILDKTAGIEFLSKTGDKVNTGDPLFRCFNSDNNKLNSATNYLKDSVAIGPEIVNPTLFYNA
jgi:thymidine phosphorylase